jgi:hypothetical protein
MGTQDGNYVRGSTPLHPYDVLRDVPAAVAAGGRTGRRFAHRGDGRGRRLDELRRNWLNPEGASEAEPRKRTLTSTLTNLYNTRPTWLENVHARLDRAAFAAYGWPSDLSERELLRNLLALNLERSRSGQESSLILTDH